jgi:hypothetical protein
VIGAELKRSWAGMALTEPVKIGLNIPGNGISFCQVVCVQALRKGSTWYRNGIAC